MNWRGLVLAAGLMAGACTMAGAGGLQPYQMVRSLELVQDRLARGDTAALPMQRRLLEMIDERLQAASAADFDDPRNYEALMIFAMSGGNPATIRHALSLLDLPQADRPLAVGIMEYLRGNRRRAMEILEPVDPMTLPPGAGGFLALIKGSINLIEKPGASLRYFDMARLLAPGTLIEEAALRRTIDVAADQQRADRFINASWRYARRFIRSPYATQFADSFVGGMLKVGEVVNLTEAHELIGDMHPEQSRVVYLRIARRAAIEGRERLVAFARDGLSRHEQRTIEAGDPRAVLYEGLALIASDRVEEIKARLSLIDRSRLSAGDRLLLDAALALGSEVVAPAQVEEAAAPSSEPLVEETDLTAEDPDSFPFAPGEGPMAETPPASTVAGSEPRQTGPAPTASGNDATSLPGLTPIAPSSSADNAFVGQMRERLHDIDRLLEDSGS